MDVQPVRVAVAAGHCLNLPVKLSIIIPTLNEAESIIQTLTPLQSLRQAGHEVWVVDGGSTDNTQIITRPLCNGVIQSRKGRAIQMHAGANHACNEILLFLHADTRLPDKLPSLFQRFEQQRYFWGHFRLQLSNTAYFYRVLAFFINQRTRLSQIATGDQCIFISRSLYQTIGGYPQIPLMEDIAISKRLKKYTPPICLIPPVVTSSRRWEKHGRVKTILIMWLLRGLYAIGISPKYLARWYQSS